MTPKPNQSRLIKPTVMPRRVSVDAIRDALSMTFLKTLLMRSLEALLMLRQYKLTYLGYHLSLDYGKKEVMRSSFTLHRATMVTSCLFARVSLHDKVAQFSNCIESV